VSASVPWYIGTTHFTNDSPVTFFQNYNP
jgi:hypothetical protein